MEFLCCFCTKVVATDDPESAQIAVIHPWEGDEEPNPQYFFAHRKPCLMAAMDPSMRAFYDDGEDDDWEIVNFVPPDDPGVHGL